MKKIWVLVMVILLSVAVVGCGGGSAPGGGSSDTYTPYVGSPVVVDGATVPTSGWLQVVNGNLCNESGTPVQLRGMSSMGLQWFPYSAATITNLVSDWHITVFRAAMYVTEGGYLINPAVKDKLEILVQEAIKQGIYVIIDWHTLNDGNGYVTSNPNGVKNQAKTFFSEMATKYGNYPNVIYEICNEPNGASTTWAQIKSYAREVIPIIRAKDPDGIIIVGTPTWSQEVDKPANDPIAGKNIMYTLHFYAGTHTQWLRDRANAALAKGIGLFVTEWGTSEASGNGGPYFTEAQTWIDWMSDHNISWVNWSLCNKNETSAALKPTSNVEGPWLDSELSASGAWVKDRI